MNRSILHSLQWRYATKKFDPSRKLSEEKLNVIKESFNLTATSYGLQPLKLVIVSNTKLQEQLVPLTMEQVQVRDASHVLVFCIETAISKNYITEYFDRVEHTRNTPRAILKPFEKFLIEEFTEKPEVAVETWMQKQAYIAMGNLLTVCALEGIDACPIEGFLPEAYDELLQLKDLELQSVLVMPVGYRADDDFFADLKKVRRGVDEVVIEMK